MFFEDFINDTRDSNYFSPLIFDMFKVDFEIDFWFNEEDFKIFYQCLQIPEYFYLVNIYKVEEQVV